MSCPHMLYRETMGTETLRLSVSEAVAAIDLRERAVAFQKVTSLAAAGGAGLARMIGEGLSEEVKVLLNGGRNFLRQGRLDAEHYLHGVEIVPGVTTRARTDDDSPFRCYRPGEVFWGITTSYQDGVIPKQDDIERIAKEVDKRATELLSFFGRTTGGGDQPSERETNKVLEEYNNLAAPYLIISQRATSDFIGGIIPRNIER